MPRSNNVFAVTNQAQKCPLLKQQQQSYSNDNIFDKKTILFLPEATESTNSLPNLFGERTSFAKFISDEKYNLQFFPSFKKTQNAINDRNEKKKLIRNFHSLSYDISNNYSLAFANFEIINNDKTRTSMTHSSKFALSTFPSTSTLKTTEYTRNILVRQSIGNNNMASRKHCVEPYINYMNNEQDKATRCFILQINSYINQNVLSSRKPLDIQPKQLGVPTKELTKLKMNTTLNLDYISKSIANDSIDISMQLSDNLQTTSDDHYILPIFYNQPITNNIYSSMKKEYEDETVSDNDVLNRIIDGNKTHSKNRRLTMNIRSKFHHEPFAAVSIRNIEDVTYMPKTSLEQRETSMKSFEKIETKDSSTNRIKSLDKHQSSIDLRNFLNESNEMKSSVPFQSRCSVALEFADQEQHSVEVIELPRSCHHTARIRIYKQIRKRLAVENLTDIDPTALLRTVL